MHSCLSFLFLRRNASAPPLQGLAQYGGDDADGAPAAGAGRGSQRQEPVWGGAAHSLSHPQDRGANQTAPGVWGNWKHLLVPAVLRIQAKNGFSTVPGSFVDPDPYWIPIQDTDPYPHMQI